MIAFLPPWPAPFHAGKPSAIEGLLPTVFQLTSRRGVAPDCDSVHADRKHQQVVSTKFNFRLAGHLAHDVMLSKTFDRNL
jgi:hypothetical protein